MVPREKLHRLIAVNAPLWAGEAEVFRAYWSWRGRTRETELRWLLRQTFKELQEGFVNNLARVEAALRREDRPLDGEALIEAVSGMLDESRHYLAFAEVYEKVRRGDDPPLTLGRVRNEGDWPENAALRHLRNLHVERHGSIGWRARWFTEAGYCTLFSEGMKLRGGGEIDDAIATACARVYEDEFNHMLQGIAGLETEELSEREWDLLADLTVEQMRCRIPMRNAQFSYPLSEDRVAALCRGGGEPLPFDYARAGLPPPA